MSTENLTTCWEKLDRLGAEVSKNLNLRKAFADDLLGRGGKLTTALNRHYRYQLEHDDHFDEWMTSLGRAREVALGKAA